MVEVAVRTVVIVPNSLAGGGPCGSQHIASLEAPWHTGASLLQCLDDMASCAPRHLSSNSTVHVCAVSAVCPLQGPEPCRFWSSSLHRLRRVRSVCAAAWSKAGTSVSRPGSPRLAVRHSATGRALPLNTWLCSLRCRGSSTALTQSVLDVAELGRPSAWLLLAMWYLWRRQLNVKRCVLWSGTL